MFTGTGPSLDHTFFAPTGSYLMLNSSLPSVYGQEAWLVSKTLKSNGKCSLIFYYTMFGDNLGSLNVFYRKEIGGELVGIFSAQVNLGNYWSRAELPNNIFPSGENPYEVIIKATVGEEERSNIAIDDLVFHKDCELNGSPLPTAPTSPATGTTASTPSNSCNDDEMYCQDGDTCIPIEKRCNFVEDCPSGDVSDEKDCVAQNCTFEGGDLCGWRISSNSHDEFFGERKGEVLFTWEITRGIDREGADDTLYKPLVDHTDGKNTSYYAYTHSARGQYEDSSRLFTSIPLGETATTCRLSFWFYLTGPETGSLNILLEDENGQITEIYSLDGDQGEKWIREQVLISRVYRNRVILEAKRGTSDIGGLSVDDLSFKDCEPPSPPPSGEFCGQLREFECDAGGECLNDHLICDFSSDCPDASDESPSVCSLYDTRCDFEAGLICDDFVQETDDTLDWTVVRTLESTSYDGPSHDHSTMTSEGHFMELAPLLDVDGLQEGRLRTGVLRGEMTDCQFRMWYYLTGEPSGNITIYKRRNYLSDGLTALKTIAEPEGHIWLRMEVELHEENLENYQVVIEGVVESGKSGTLGVDDISLSMDCSLAPSQTLPGSEDTTASPSVCPGDLLPCDTIGECYHPIERCDFSQACSDGKDEQDCCESWIL